MKFWKGPIINVTSFLDGGNPRPNQDRLCSQQSTRQGSVFRLERFVHWTAGLQVDNCSGGGMIDGAGREERSLTSLCSRFQTGCRSLTGSSPARGQESARAPGMSQNQSGEVPVCLQSRAGRDGSETQRADPVEENCRCVCVWERWVGLWGGNGVQHIQTTPEKRPNVRICVLPGWLRRSRGREVSCCCWRGREREGGRDQFGITLHLRWFYELIR